MTKINQITAIRITLESLWLLAVVGIPLIAMPYTSIMAESSISHVEVPKVVLLRLLVTLMVVITLWEIVLTKDLRIFRLNLTTKPFYSFLKQNHYSWTLMAIAAVGVSTLLGTLFSTRFQISLWGAIPKQDGHALINTFSYLVLFYIIASHIKTRHQVNRLAISIIASGVSLGILGIVQNLGHNPFHLSGYTNMERIPLTMGNPIFAASFLCLTIATSLVTCSLVIYKKKFLDIYKIHHLIIWSLIISIQITGLIHTLSRGAWVSVAVLICIFFIGIWVCVGWRIALKIGTVFAIATIISFSAIAATEKESSRTSSQIADRVASIQSEVLTGDLNQRIPIWLSSWRIVVSRPWFEDQYAPNKWLTIITGYGPDMFRFVFPLNSPLNRFESHLPIEAHNAHNFFLHQLVEQGVLGLLSSLFLFISIVTSSISLLIRKASMLSVEYRMVVIGIIAIVISRAVEQSVGVGRISDMTLFWIILAAMIALPNILNRESVIVATKRNKHDEMGTQSIPANSLSPRWVLPISIISIIVCYISFTEHVQYLRATLSASEAKHYYATGELNSAYITIERAINLSPNIPTYYLFKNMMISDAIRNDIALDTFQCPVTNTQINHRQCLLKSKYQSAKTAVKHQPLYWRSVFEQAVSADHLIKYDEALKLYEQTSALIPNSWPLHNQLAGLYISEEQYDKAEIHLNRSLSITQQSSYNIEGQTLRQTLLERMQKVK